MHVCHCCFSKLIYTYVSLYLEIDVYLDIRPGYRVDTSSFQAVGDDERGGVTFI